MINQSFAMQFQLCLRLKLRILTVPNCCIVVSCLRRHNDSQNRLQVEGRVLAHNGIKQVLGFEIFISPLFKFVFGWDSSIVALGVRLIPIVIGLNQEPILISKFIGSVYFFIISFDDNSLIAFNSRHNEVHRPSNPLLLQSLDSSLERTFLIDYFLQQPAGGNGIFHQKINKVIFKTRLSPCIDLHRKRARLVGRQGEDTTHQCIYSVDELISTIVLDISCHVGQKFPHAEVQITAVKNFPLLSSDYHTSACLDGRILVHEVQKEYFLELVP